MDERKKEQIDRYLRKEMSPNESLLFEQEALNDKQLRDEIVLTYRIRRSLIDRQKKLRQTADWERKRQWLAPKSVLAVVSSIAAMAVVVFLAVRPGTASPEGESMLIAQAAAYTDELSPNENLLASQKVTEIRKSFKEGKNREVIEDIEQMEKDQELPTLATVSREVMLMSNTVTAETRQVTATEVAYDLHWMKICSMKNVGETDSAIASLKEFVTIDGQYKQQADSLLKLLKNK